MKQRTNGRASVRSHAEPNDTLLGVFLSENGRLPPFAQRRLDSLIAKKKAEGLTRDEARELREALDYVEVKSIELLAHAASLNPAASTASPPKRRPLWQRYLDTRCRQLMAR